MTYALVVFVVTVCVLIGALVLLVMLVEFPYFSEQSPPGEIGLRKAERVQAGMTRDEVLALLGIPQARRDPKGKHECWEYEVVTRKSAANKRLLILFDNVEGRVSTIDFQSERADEDRSR